jgi:Phage integrase, N-terminal SAM-like domain
LTSPFVHGLLGAASGRRVLTAAEFQELAAVPLEAEWFANIDNPRTRRGYRVDIHEFIGFMGIAQPEEFRKVTRAHVLAWRKDLEGRELSGPTIRRKLAALCSLFEHLCDANAVTHNPVKGVKRPEGRATRARRRSWATDRRGLYSVRRGRGQRRAAGSRHSLGVALPRTAARGAQGPGHPSTARTSAVHSSGR